MKDLDSYLAEHVIGYRWWFDVLSLEAMLCPPSEMWPERKSFKVQSEPGKPFGATDCTDLFLFKPTTDPAAALAVLERLYEDDPNDILLALHNFLILPEFKERTLTPLKICLFARKHLSK